MQGAWVRSGLEALHDSGHAGSRWRRSWRDRPHPGADHNVLIAGNKITGKGGTGIQVGDELPEFGITGPTANSDITVADNIITGPGKDGVRIFHSTGVRVRHNLILNSGNDGIAFTAPAGTPPSSDATISQNTILRSRGAASGIDLAAGSYTGPLTVRYNRIVYSVSGHGLVNDAGVPADARLNWWGCNPPGRHLSRAAGSRLLRPAARLSRPADPWTVLRRRHRRFHRHPRPRRARHPADHGTAARTDNMAGRPAPPGQDLLTRRQPDRLPAVPAQASTDTQTNTDTKAQADTKAPA